MRAPPLITFVLGICLTGIGNIAQGQWSGQQPPNDRSAPEYSDRDAPTAVPSRILGRPDFGIPFDISPDHPGNPVEIRLYVSRDRGQDWQLYQRRALNAENFQFRAPDDGEYWFFVRTVDRQGQIIGQQQAAPELKIMIDTRRPHLDLRVTMDESGHVKATWNAEDPNLAPHTFRLQYQDINGQWADVYVRTPAEDDWRQQWEQEAEWWIKDRRADVQVRAEIQDRADNVTQIAKRVGLAAGDGGPFRQRGQLPADESMAQRGFREQRDWQQGFSDRGYSEPELRDRDFADGRSGGQGFSQGASTELNGHQRSRFTPVAHGSGRNADNASGQITDAGRDHRSRNEGFQRSVSDGGFGSERFDIDRSESGSDPYGRQTRSTEDRDLPDARDRFDPSMSVDSESARARTAAQRSLDEWTNWASKGLKNQWPDLFGGSAGRSPATRSPSNANGSAGSGHQPWARTHNLPAEEVAARQPPPREQTNRAQTRSPNRPLPGAVSPPVATNRGRPGWGATNPTVNAATNPMANAAAASTPRPRITSSPNFALDYGLYDVGPEGPDRVELWYSRDRGATWQRYGVDQDRKPPMEVRVREQGLYGFRLVVQGRSKPASPAPKPGDTADMWVGVDWMKPQARIVDAHYATEGGRTTMVIDWQVSDALLTEYPIAINYRTSLQSGWKPVAHSLRNSGSYKWELERRFAEQVYLQLEVRDQAGNVVTTQLDRPVGPQTSNSPRGVIRNLLEIGTGETTSAQKPATFAAPRWR